MERGLLRRMGVCCVRFGSRSNYLGTHASWLMIDPLDDFVLQPLSQVGVVPGSGVERRRGLRHSTGSSWLLLLLSLLLRHEMQVSFVTSVVAGYSSIPIFALIGTSAFNVLFTRCAAYNHGV